MSSDLKSNLHQINLKAVKPSDSGVYEFEDFRLDAAHLMLYCKEEEVHLTPKQVETLLALVERSGEIVSKDELMQRLWGNAVVEESNLIQNIYILRKILGETADGKPMIETLRRRGYRFNGELKQNEQIQSETVPEQQAKEAAKLKELPSSISDKVSVEKEGVVDSTGRNRTAAVFATAILLIVVIGFGYYYLSARKAAVGDKKSIAVLPFKPINTANRDEFYEIGIAEILINQLGSTKGFVVRPLSAIRKYSDIEQDALAAGREQQVDYVLASNYQLANGKIRVTAQLFNVTSGQIEETYRIEKEAGDIFAMQDEIASDIGNRLLAHFAIAPSSKAKAKRGTTNEEAYRFYLHGRNLTWQQKPASGRKAIEYFEQAVRLDPNFAGAYSGLARAYIVSGSGGGLPRIESEKAKDALKKALELDGNLAEAYAVCGHLKINNEWDLAGAEKDLQRAIELEPNNDLAHWVYANLLSYRGRFDDSLRK
jgi:DNA-binding winged helix-turn-helix (wHTH) protein/TolB-like protein